MIEKFVWPTLTAIISGLAMLWFTQYSNNPNNEHDLVSQKSALSINGSEAVSLINDYIKAIEPSFKFNELQTLMLKTKANREMVATKIVLKNQSNKIYSNVNIELTGYDIYSVSHTGQPNSGSGKFEQKFKMNPSDEITIFGISPGYFYSHNNTYSTTAKAVVSIDGRIVRDNYIIYNSGQFDDAVIGFARGYPAVTSMLLFLGAIGTMLLFLSAFLQYYLNTGNNYIKNRSKYFSNLEYSRALAAYYYVYKFQPERVPEIQSKIKEILRQNELIDILPEQTPPPSTPPSVIP